MMFGNVETLEERIEHLEVVRSQQDLSLGRLRESGRLGVGPEATAAEMGAPYSEAVEPGDLN